MGKAEPFTLSIGLMPITTPNWCYRNSKVIGASTPHVIVFQHSSKKLAWAPQPRGSHQRCPSSSSPACWLSSQVRLPGPSRPPAGSSSLGMLRSGPPQGCPSQKVYFLKKGSHRWWGKVTSENRLQIRNRNGSFSFQGQGSALHWELEKRPGPWAKHLYEMNWVWGKKMTYSPWLSIFLSRKKII